MNNSQIVLLVKECLKGNKESYSLIIRHFQQKVYNLCFHFLGTSQDAEDAAIEVFIKAYRALKDFNPQYAFSTWLSRIAINHSIGVLRRQKIERDYLMAEATNPTSLTDGKSPDTVFFNNSRQKALESILPSLPVKYRTALMLKYQQDLSYKEISDIMDVPVNTVGSLILRAKQELREKLNPNQRGGRRPQPIHGQTDAVLSGLHLKSKVWRKNKVSQGISKKSRRH
jgi:RNA polymerase sigma-70 factor (ECF subfamily)